MPLWAVEVLYRQVSFGRESNTTGTVTVGSPVRPVLGEFAPVAFVGLTVEVRVIKASGVSRSRGARRRWRRASRRTSPPHPPKRLARVVRRVRRLRDGRRGEPRRLGVLPGRLER